ncbi:DUF3048 domain-containing protein [Salinibacterium sp. ZJ450]|uniref:DUF3048 domain-containing protein n=1 Tax=Salinibacterium sp. ZJ450 TaxID=2708338 RepID=UPI001420B124|nr:DUF3048 domain-containing protein [Salinibacterium sp. ZJ450]
MRAWGNSQRHRTIAVIGLGVLLLTGCSATEPPKAKPSASAGPVWDSSYEAPAPTVIAPLTGETVQSDALDHPSIAAKIDNHPLARAQFGLNETDIVFEELVEGGMTRYVGVWHSTVPEILGPVRSIRPMDPDIISPLGGIVAYSGGQPGFVNMMQSAPVYNAIHGQADTATTFFRSPAKRAPHNVHVKAREVVAQHDDLKAPQQHFAFSLDIPSSTAAKDGTPTARVNLTFGSLGTPSWAWDAATGAWGRFMTGGATDTDNTGAQLTATNLVVLRVPVTVSADIPKTELIGSGEAWVSTGGATVHATWRKDSQTDTIKLVDDNGVTVRLAPGNSWVELVPTQGSVAFVAP